jgi:hypothetical protein
MCPSQSRLAFAAFQTLGTQVATLRLIEARFKLVHFGNQTLLNSNLQSGGKLEMGRP